MNVRRLIRPVAAITAVVIGGSVVAKTAPPHTDIIDFSLAASDFLQYVGPTATPPGPATLDFSVTFDPYGPNPVGAGWVDVSDSTVGNKVGFAYQTDSPDQNHNPALHLGSLPDVPFNRFDLGPGQFISDISFPLSSNPSASFLECTNASGQLACFGAANVTVTSQILQTAVPETGAWVTILLGMAGIGGAMRRTRRRVAVA